MKSTIRISSRKSDLARLQSYLVGEAIQKHVKGVKIEYQFRESLGDRNLENPLWKMPEKGVFTQDFKEDLVTGKTDLVVHSWKDLPIEESGVTCVVASLPRADERDLFLFKKQSRPSKGQSLALKVFSSSPRRAFNLVPFFQWSLPFETTSVEFLPVRGNIQTRIQKAMATDDVHGIIIAKAALDRLLTARSSEFVDTQKFLKKALAQFEIQIIPLSQSPTSAAQGALAIEIASKNRRIKNILKAINATEDFRLVTEERQHFKSWGGGCHQKMGVTLKMQSEHVMRFERGLDQGDNFVWNQDILRGPFKQLQRPIAIDSVVETHAHLEKQILNLKPYRAKKNEALIITKGNLLHKNSGQPTCLWTSGIETWKQLAAMGFWVTGSYDSLGETQRPEIDALYARNLKWKKLTHQQGRVKRWAALQKLYKIQYRGWDQVYKFKNKKYFFWSHGELFLSCWKRFPWLKTKTHICGLGNTLDIVSKYVEPKNLITVYNYKDWKKKWTQ
ncbi:MAG: hypothetical protein JNL11_01025 [Bdellovibrionaceae bacterium]|nr:hypothetical protein [Pseudobdellovibrionaceae bacterium]